MIVAEGDTVTPPGPARHLAERAPRGELHTFPGGHFETYFGENFQQVAEREVEFLTRTLREAPSAAPIQSPTSSS